MVAVGLLRLENTGETNGSRVIAVGDPKSDIRENVSQDVEVMVTDEFTSYPGAMKQTGLSALRMPDHGRMRLRFIHCYCSGHEGLSALHRVSG